MQQTLIDEGLLRPGEGVLSLQCKQLLVANLTADGEIICHSAPFCLNLSSGLQGQNNKLFVVAYKIP